MFAGQPCYGETGDIKPWPPSPGPADPQYDLPSKGELFLTYAREVNIRVCGELQVAVQTGEHKLADASAGYINRAAVQRRWGLEHV